MMVPQKKPIREFEVVLWEEFAEALIMYFVVSFTTKKGDVDELICFVKTNLAV